MEEEDILFLEKSIHLNRFSKDFDLEVEERAHILSELMISIDGAILGVNRKKVEPFFDDPEVRKLRYGVIKMPQNFKLENEEDFFKLLAVLIPLEETF